MLEYPKIIELIVFIKSIINKDYEEIYSIILKKFEFYIEKKELKEKDILFLYNIIFNNESIDNDVIANAFINSNKTIEQKIFISSSIGEVSIIDLKKEQLKMLFYNLLTEHGKIIIILE